MKEAKFAKVSWAIGDVTSLFDITEDEAHEFLFNNANRIAGSMVEHGWSVIELLGQEEGFKANEIQN